MYATAREIRGSAANTTGKEGRTTAERVRGVARSPAGPLGKQGARAEQRSGPDSSREGPCGPRTRVKASHPPGIRHRGERVARGGEGLTSSRKLHRHDLVTPGRRALSDGLSARDIPREPRRVTGKLGRRRGQSTAPRPGSWREPRGRDSGALGYVTQLSSDRAETPSRIQMFFQKKKKKERRKNTNTYFYVCITCLREERRAERGWASGAAEHPGG